MDQDEFYPGWWPERQPDISMLYRSTSDRTEPMDERRRPAKADSSPVTAGSERADEVPPRTPLRTPRMLMSVR